MTMWSGYYSVNQVNRYLIMILQTLPMQNAQEHRQFCGRTTVVEFPLFRSGGVLSCSELLCPASQSVFRSPGQSVWLLGSGCQWCAVVWSSKSSVLVSGRPVVLFCLLCLSFFCVLFISCVPMLFCPVLCCVVCPSPDAPSPDMCLQ